VHQRWKHRHDRNGEKHLYASYRERRDNAACRPPRGLRHDGKPDRKGTISKISGCWTRDVRIEKINEYLLTH